MANSMDAFLYAIRKQESGGNYKIVNSSSGALGAYQIMPYHVADWTKQAIGHSLTAQQYLADPAAQDAVARVILGGYYSKYGPAGAAAMWYSGQSNPNKTYGNPPVYKYVASVLAIMGTSAAASAGGLDSGVYTTPSGGTATPASDTSHADCLWGVNLPVVGFTCILTQGQGRAIKGALLLVAATVVGGAGLIILSAYGLKKSGALDTAAAAASVVPGAGAVAGKLAAGSARIKATPQPTPKKKPKAAPEKPKAAPEKQEESAP